MDGRADGRVRPDAPLVLDAAAVETTGTPYVLARDAVFSTLRREYPCNPDENS